MSLTPRHRFGMIPAMHSPIPKNYAAAAPHRLNQGLIISQPAGLFGHGPRSGLSWGGSWFIAGS
jgi:hypothetical protein